MNFSDEELMVMFAAGTSEAFTMLYERYHNRIYAFALSCLASPHDAEDAVQEIFLNVARAVNQYQPRNRFKAWLFQIAANRIRDIGRRENLQHFRFGQRLKLLRTNDRISDQGQQVRRMETQNEIQRMILNLNADERTILILKEFEGLDIDSIAHIVGLTPGNVRVKIHRARKKLVDIMQREND